MTATLTELSPSLVWKHFDEIRRIPRGSKNETAAAEYVVSVAERNGRTVRRDAVGNVVVEVPATPGREGTEIVVLQSHLDMVNEKNDDVDHDFAKDPIDAYVDGDWVRARGTTLGSDNGIGVAMALAVLEDDGFAHGPIELLFTIDEETGMTGAMGLSEEMLRGRRMINLDTEEENAIYIGCAGGVDVLLDRPVMRHGESTGAARREIRVSGLVGGHSGCDIHLQRGNANRILARVLGRAAEAVDFGLVSLQGGNLRNALPREATAVVALDGSDADSFEKAVASEAERIRAELERSDPDVAVDVREASGDRDAISIEDTRELVAFLVALPHGVAAMSLAVPGLVETSTNFATVELMEDRLSIVMLSRGSVKSGLDAMNRRIRSIASLAGASYREEGEYPGWTPDPDAELLRTAIRVHERVVGVTPETKAIHAGLECGVIGKAFPGMQMISVGPRIEGAHSPDERVRISTVDACYAYLRTLLDALSSDSDPS